MSQTVLKSRDQEVFEEGVEEGRLRQARKGVRILLEDRFGELPRSIVDQIEATSDRDRLGAVLRQALRIANLAEFQL